MKKKELLQHINTSGWIDNPEHTCFEIEDVLSKKFGLKNDQFVQLINELVDDGEIKIKYFLEDKTPLRRPEEWYLIKA